MITFREALNLALADALAEDDRVFLLGEDIAAAGGVAVIGLTRLMIFPADDQHIVVTAILRRQGVNPHIVVRIERIPIQRLFHCPLRQPGSDDIGRVGRLLGMNGHNVADGRVGGDDDRFRSYDMAPIRFNACRRPALDRLHMSGPEYYGRRAGRSHGRVPQDISEDGTGPDAGIVHTAPRPTIPPGFD